MNLHRLSVLDDLSGRAVRRLADEDAARRSSRLQPCAYVHDVAGGDTLTRLGQGRQRDEGLACMDTDPYLEPEGWIGGVELCNPVVDRERRAQGALRIVLVCERRPEQTDDGIADELLDRAADELQLAPGPRVVEGEPRAHILGVGIVCSRRRADEVGVENRHDLAFLDGNG